VTDKKQKAEDTPIVAAKGGGTNHLSDPAPYGDHPPRLHIGINDALTDMPEGAVWNDAVGGAYQHFLPPHEASSINDILEWVAGRLDEDLTKAWETQADQVRMWKTSDPDEAWAQAISEAFLGVTYAGPGQTYFADGVWDAYIFSRVQTRTRHVAGRQHVQSWKNPVPNDAQAAAPSDPWSDNDDPAISVVVACQQLTSYAAVTRGFTVEEDLDGSGYTASQACAGLSIVKSPGAFYATNTHPNAGNLLNVAHATTESPALDVGTFYTYNPRGWDENWSGAQDFGSHINVVLRLHPSKDRCQRFDTVNGPDLSELQKEGLRDRMFAALPQQGILDSNVTRTVSAGNKFVGMGVPKPTDEAKLEEQTEHLRRARPIGLMRFFVTIRNEADEQRVRAAVPKEDQLKAPPPQKGEVLYASKLLRCYGDGSDQNYPTSRLLWSLRNTPGLDALQPWWVLMVPCEPGLPSKLGRSMWAPDARTMKLKDYCDHFKVKSIAYASHYRVATVMTNHGMWPAKDCGRAMFWARSKLGFDAEQRQVFEGYPVPSAIMSLVRSLRWDQGFKHASIKGDIDEPGHFGEG
jgi:hypothetical protein